MDIEVRAHTTWEPGQSTVRTHIDLRQVKVAVFWNAFAPLKRDILP